MKIMIWIVKLIVAVGFGAVFAAVLTPGLAAFVDVGAGAAAGGVAGYGLLAGFGGAALLILFAPTVRRAFGRGFLLCGMAFLFLPLGAMLLSGRVSIDVMEAGLAASATDAELAGTAIGAGLATGVTALAAGAIGFVMGAICLVAGLVLALGGRREVVIVDSPNRPGRADHPGRLTEARPDPGHLDRSRRE